MKCRFDSLTHFEVGGLFLTHLWKCFINSGREPVVHYVCGKYLLLGGLLCFSPNGVLMKDVLSFNVFVCITLSLYVSWVFLCCL